MLPKTILPWYNKNQVIKENMFPRQKLARLKITIIDTFTINIKANNFICRAKIQNSNNGYKDTTECIFDVGKPICFRENNDYFKTRMQDIP